MNVVFISKLYNLFSWQSSVYNIWTGLPISSTAKFELATTCIGHTTDYMCFIKEYCFKCLIQNSTFGDVLFYLCEIYISEQNMFLFWHSCWQFGSNGRKLHNTLSWQQRRKMWWKYFSYRIYEWSVSWKFLDMSHRIIALV